jgi:hypothetical protein
VSEEQADQPDETTDEATTDTVAAEEATTDEVAADDATGDAIAEGGDGAEAPVAPLQRDELGGGGGLSPKVKIALGVVAVLVLGLLIGRLTAGDDDGGGEGDGEALPAEGGVDFPAGDVNRTGYWGFVSLTPITIDTFDRADDPTSLGDAGEGGTWEAVNGTWGIREDAAFTSGGTGDGPFLAVVPQGEGDGLTEVTMTVVEEGAGLVFRYLDPENYWAITANPGVGSWSVNRVIDGEAELVGELPGPTADNTTVSVEQKGTSLRFLLDGLEYLALTDGALADQLQGGMIASGATTGEARWNRFLVLTYPPEGTDTTTTTAAP